MNRKAVRAIIIKDNQLLMMFRNKHGHKYYTLVGGQVEADEDLEQALIREVKEETGLTITSYREVFYENHSAPLNEQHIYLCEVASDSEVNIQSSAEEAFMNKLGMNIHQPVWVNIRNAENLQFRTPQLLNAILDGIKNGFPDSPIQIS